MFVVYILVNNRGRYYIGQTNNLKKRVFQHNNNNLGYTKIGRPWRLVYFEYFVTRNEAIIRESQLKSYKGGKAFKSLLRL